MTERFHDTTAEAVRSALASRREAQTRFLAELVKVPSDNPPGDCARHAERAAELLEELGFKVERHPVPEDVVRANGMISATNLVVRRRFGEGPVVALNAHGDVVPPGEGWTKDPYGAEIVDGWMYGRGVAVSKSDFATYAFALLALEPVRASLRGAVELHLTYDEEAGGEIGSALLLKEGVSKPDLAIGAGFSYAVVNAHNGCLHLEVQVDGRSARCHALDRRRCARGCGRSHDRALCNSRASVGAEICDARHRLSPIDDWPHPGGNQYQCHS